MKKMTLILVFVTLALLQLLTIAALLHMKTKYDMADARIVAKIHESPARNAQRVCGKRACNVDFFNLQMEREKFQDRLVRITGYLAIYDGLLLLFPTELDYSIGHTEAALQIRLDESTQKALFDSHGYSFIRLAAVYSATDPNAVRGNYLGILKAPHQLLGLPDRLRKEQWSDIKIHVDDLER